MTKIIKSKFEKKKEIMTKIGATNIVANQSRLVSDLLQGHCSCQNTSNSCYNFGYKVRAHFHKFWIALHLVIWC